MNQNKPHDLSQTREVFAFPTYTDNDAKKGAHKGTQVYQMEVYSIDPLTADISLLYDICSTTFEKDIPDWQYKTSLLYSLIRDKYAYFQKGEVIYIYGHDMYLRNLCDNLNDITLRISNKSMKTRYENDGAEKFVSYLIDALHYVNKRNQSAELVRKYLIEVMPILITAPRKEVVFKEIPRNKMKYKKRELSSLDMKLYEIQHKLVIRTHYIMDEVAGKTREQVDKEIKRKFNIKKQIKNLKQLHQ